MVALPGVPRREAVRNDGELALADFLALPERTAKPRSRGVTHVVDRGLPIATLESLLDLAGAHIDFVKFGWGTAYVSRHIRAKVVACREAKVQTCIGGTLLELACVQGKMREFVRWADSIGFDAVEVSEGTVELGTGIKAGLIEAMARDFVVLAETGSEDSEAPVPRRSGRPRCKPTSAPAPPSSWPKGGSRAPSGSTIRPGGCGRRWAGG